MIGAYYTKGLNSNSIFQNFAISKTSAYSTHLNAHNVCFIDMSHTPDACQDYHSYQNSIISKLKEDLIEAYPHLSQKEYDSISYMLRDSGDSFIFILDEWDSIFYKNFMTQQDKNAYLSFLKNLLKDQPYVELAYMTGVLPITKYSSGSELNMFREYNFMNDNIYDIFFGLHEDEVKELCTKHHSVSYDELAY